MPCSDGYDSRFDDILKRETELKRRLDLSTRLLCGLLTQLTTTPIVDAGTREVLFRKVPGLMEWWNSHQEEDRRRELEEARRNRRDIKRLTKTVAENQRELARNQEQLRKAKNALALSPHANVPTNAKLLKPIAKKRTKKN